MSDAPQSYENHARFVTGYHRVGFPMVALPALFFLVRAFTDFSPTALALALFALGTAICVFYARTFATGVQDRVIRLEEQIRMERLLSPDLLPRLDEISTRQRVALRFASDGELESLVRRVLQGEVTSAKEIKSAIEEWRPDHERI